MDLSLVIHSLYPIRLFAGLTGIMNILRTIETHTEKPQRTTQARADGCGWDAERLANLAGVHARVIAQHDDQTRVCIQAIERLTQIHDGGMKTVAGVCVYARERVFACCGVKWLHETALCSKAPSLPVQTDIDGDAQQPGMERHLAVQRMPCLPTAQKGFLRGIFGVSRSDQRRRDTQHRREMWMYHSSIAFAICLLSHLCHVCSPPRRRVAFPLGIYPALFSAAQRL